MSPAPINQSVQRRRRAIVTGLAPYMNEPVLLEAISHWQLHYAERPSFSLQGFVSDLCRLFDLGERRHHIHMSLVQAMTLSDSELAADPLANSNDSHTEAHPCTHAFQCLLQALWQRLGKRAATQLQLDLGAQLRQRSVSAETRLTMEYWLQSPDKSLSPLPLASLRDQLNRTYVLLCEQLGPVEADQQLKAAYQATLARLDDKEALQTLM
ncbi:hypothetical protein [Alcanivorax sp.]|jgi:hypothetical protein|uniref:hypothetical protein n=1 Tax=Alcanivorax sp. TaxID=1872427 RepID=UPI0025BE77EA|nr:hypothetical protein [Alcanivorax sp.]